MNLIKYYQVSLGLFLALVISSCSTSISQNSTNDVVLDEGKVEKQIEKGIFNDTNADTAVECFGDLIGVIGEDFVCEVELDYGAIYEVYVTIKSKSGRFRWQMSEEQSNPNGYVYLDPYLVESQVADQIFQQEGFETEIDCPDRMSGKIGDTIDCYATDNWGATSRIVIEIRDKAGYFYWQLAFP